MAIWDNLQCHNIRLPLGHITILIINKSSSIIHQQFIHALISNITQYNTMQLHLLKYLSQYFTNITSMITDPFLIVTTSIYIIIMVNIPIIYLIYTQKYTNNIPQYISNQLHLDMPI